MVQRIHLEAQGVRVVFLLRVVGHSWHWHGRSPCSRCRTLLERAVCSAASNLICVRTPVSSSMCRLPSCNRIMIVFHIIFRVSFLWLLVFVRMSCYRVIWKVCKSFIFNGRLELHVKWLLASVLKLLFPLMGWIHRSLIMTKLIRTDMLCLAVYLSD